MRHNHPFHGVDPIDSGVGLRRNVFDPQRLTKVGCLDAGSCEGISCNRTEVLFKNCVLPEESSLTIGCSGKCGVSVESNFEACVPLDQKGPVNYSGLCSRLLCPDCGFLFTGNHLHELRGIASTGHQNHRVGMQSNFPAPPLVDPICGAFAVEAIPPPADGHFCNSAFRQGVRRLMCSIRAIFHQNRSKIGRFQPFQVDCGKMTGTSDTGLRVNSSQLPAITRITNDGCWSPPKGTFKDPKCVTLALPHSTEPIG